jgi:hypothetical protein
MHSLIGEWPRSLGKQVPLIQTGAPGLLLLETWDSKNLNYPLPLSHLPLRLHHHLLPQNSIHARLVSRPGLLEPRHHVRIQPHGNRLLHRLVNPACANRPQPLFHPAHWLFPGRMRQFSSVGKINRPALRKPLQFSLSLHPHLRVLLQRLSRHHPHGIAHGRLFARSARRALQR